MRFECSNCEQRRVEARCCQCCCQHDAFQRDNLKPGAAVETPRYSMQGATHTAAHTVWYNMHGTSHTAVTGAVTFTIACVGTTSGCLCHPTQLTVLPASVSVACRNTQRALRVVINGRTDRQSRVRGAADRHSRTVTGGVTDSEPSRARPFTDRDKATGTLVQTAFERRSRLSELVEGTHGDSDNKPTQKRRE